MKNKCTEKRVPISKINLIRDHGLFTHGDFPMLLSIKPVVGPGTSTAL